MGTAHSTPYPQLSAGKSIIQRLRPQLTHNAGTLCTESSVELHHGNPSAQQRNLVSVSFSPSPSLSLSQHTKYNIITLFCKEREQKIKQNASSPSNPPPGTNRLSPRSHGLLLLPALLQRLQPPQRIRSTPLLVRPLAQSPPKGNARHDA